MKLCPGCKGKGTVAWSSRHASDLGGQFSMSGEVMGDARISVCSSCHGPGMQRDAVGQGTATQFGKVS